MATVVSGDFEWDARKAAANLANHGVDFEAAAFALLDPFSIDLEDLIHAERVISLALNPATGVLYVVTCEGSSERTRIISARKANAHEVYIYKAGGS